METEVKKLEFILVDDIKLEILYHCEGGRLFEVSKKTYPTQPNWYEYFVGGCCYLTSSEYDVSELDLDINEIMKFYKTNFYLDNSGKSERYTFPNYPDISIDHY